MENEQALADAPNPEFLASKHAGIMLAKYFLYPSLLLFFFMLGAGVGGWPVGHYQEDIFGGTERNVTTDFSCLWNWKFVVFYGVSVLPLCVISMNLAHQIQRKLSGIIDKNIQQLSGIDKTFYVLNIIIFCFGAMLGFFGAVFSISWDYGI